MLGGTPCIYFNFIVFNHVFVEWGDIADQAHYNTDVRLTEIIVIINNKRT